MFTDGITNKLIGCFNANFPEDVILVRVYGQNTDLLIDRKAETENIKVQNAAAIHTAGNLASILDPDLCQTTKYL